MQPTGCDVVITLIISLCFVFVYVGEVPKHDAEWSTKTNSDLVRISDELSMFVCDTFAGNGGGVTICTE